MNKVKTSSLVASLLIATNLYSTETLETITVTSATKSEQSIKDVTSNIEVITSAELEERHFTSVEEALNTLAGINIVSNGGLGTRTILSLRGMENHRTLVLIDGTRYQDPSNTDGANFSHLMISDIERIEVLKGSQAGIWGADASAGVVNIITKKAALGTNGVINFETGSFRTNKYGALVSHKEKDYDVKLNVSKVETDGFSAATPYGKDPKDYEKDGYRNTTISLDTNYYFNDNTKINFNIKDISALGEYDKSSSSPNDTSVKNDYDVRLYNINLTHKIDNHNIKLKYELSEFKRNLIGAVANPGFTWNGTFYPGSESVKNYGGKTNNIELSDEFKYSKDSFLIAGLGANKDDVSYILTDNSSKEKDSEGKYLYITNSNKFDNLIFTQSLRYDEYNNFDNATTGKLGLKYNVNEDLSFTTNVGTGYNVPSIIKEFNPWGNSNTNLQPEETKSFDIGFAYQDLKVTYFKTKVEDLIDWKNSTYVNVEGESTFDGVEIAYKKAFNDILLSLNYTHLDTEDPDGKDLIRRAKRNLNFSVDYYGFENFHVNVNGNYIGDRTDSNNVQTGNYTVWNSVVNYEVNKKLSTYLKVDNMFDKYYQTAYKYATAPRAAYVGLRYKF